MNTITPVRSLARWAGVLLISTASGLAGFTSVQAAPITPSNVDPVQHIIDCWHALFNDPAAHAASCPPGPQPDGQLAPTFSSPDGPGCIQLSGELQVPSGATLVAALGDPQEIMKVAVTCCYPCTSAIDPAFTTFHVASLGSIRSDLQLKGNAGQHVAQSFCCID